MRWILVILWIGLFSVDGKTQKDLEGIPDSLIDHYQDYKWYDRSSIFGGTLFANFNESDSYFFNPLPNDPLPGFEIGFNIVQRSERYYQFKVGGSYQRLRFREQLIINGTPSQSELNLNLANVQVTPLIFSFRKKLLRMGLGAGGYGAYIFPPNNSLTNEAIPIYTTKTTKEYDYGFHVNFSCQYHYFFIEAKWLNSLIPYYEEASLQKKFGILGISINLLLP